ncbi:MAG: hypothetical protein ABIP75_11660, partial [Pyrinomonadaceae bacterium]
DAENNLIDAYSRKKLDHDRLAQFESHYLASPLRRDRVRFGAAWQNLNDETGNAVNPESFSGEAKDHRSLSNWLTIRPPWVWASAFAVLVLLLVVTFLVVQNRRLDQQAAEVQTRYNELLRREQELQSQVASERIVAARAEQELARIRAERERIERQTDVPPPPPVDPVNPVIAVVLAAPLRGGSQQPSITIRPGSTTLSAKLELGIADFPAFQVELVEASSGRIIGQRGHLTAPGTGDRKTVTVSFPLSLLGPGKYLLRVSGLPPGAPVELVGDYPFRVVK